MQLERSGWVSQGCATGKAGPQKPAFRGGADPTQRCTVALPAPRRSRIRLYSLALSWCLASALRPRSLEDMTLASDTCTAPTLSYTTGADGPTCRRQPQGRRGCLVAGATDGEQVVRGQWEPSGPFVVGPEGRPRRPRLAEAVAWGTGAVTPGFCLGLSLGGESHERAPCSLRRASVAHLELGLAPTGPESPHAGPTGSPAPALPVSSETFSSLSCPCPLHPSRSFSPGRPHFPVWAAPLPCLPAHRPSLPGDVLWLVTPGRLQTHGATDEGTLGNLPFLQSCRGPWLCSRLQVGTLSSPPRA